MTISLRERGVSVVLLDIEGTTTPISFVYDVLFPFVREHLREYLRSRRLAGQNREVAELLRAEYGEYSAREPGLPAWREDSEEQMLGSIADFALWLMDRDVKSPGLKLLQGLIWEDGYRSGALCGEVFPDVPEALQRWHNGDLRTAIYSSGSVLAQRLIFGHTKYGDLTQYMSAFFDTGVGAKRDRSSYVTITRELGVTAEQVFFLSDVPGELEAAFAAGLQVGLCIRPGNPSVGAPAELLTLSSFDELVV